MMQNTVQQQYDIPLHDIKPIMEVQEYSLFYFLGLVGLGIIVLFFIIYLLYKWYKKSKAFSLRKEHKQQVQNLDFSDTKNTAYAITNYGVTFKNDSPEHEKTYDELSLLLQEYKYKKSVEKFDDATLALMQKYKGML